MDVNSLGSVTASVAASTPATTGTAAKPAENKTTSAKSTNDAAAVYEKSSDSASSAKQTKTTSKNQGIDRNAVVAKMKSDMEAQKSQLFDIVRKSITGQGKAFGQATDDDMWKFLAGGDFTVDAATKEQAQADIAEDGYWGVKQTSQRLFDFASALAGDDEEISAETNADVIDGYCKLIKNYMDVSQAYYYLTYGDWYGGTYNYPAASGIDFTQFYKDYCKKITDEIRNFYQPYIDAASSPAEKTAA